MPQVPQSSLPPMQGESPLSPPSPTNLLMAAAEMKQMGRFDQDDTAPTPTPKAIHRSGTHRGKGRT